MCASSMIYDHYYEKWKVTPAPQPTGIAWQPPPPAISPEEVAEFRELLRRAREYDKKTNQPACEDAEKRRKLKELADLLGVKVDFLDDDTKGVG